MKSNGQAEMRRAYEELVDANRQLETENRRLRAEVERLRRERMAGGAGAKTSDAGQRAPASSGASVGAGQLVEYLPSGGKEGTVPQTALVLEVKPNGLLRLRVKRSAQPDKDLDDVGPERWRRHRAE